MNSPVTDETPHLRMSTPEAVRQLAEVIADLIKHQQDTAEVVKELTDKVAKLEGQQP